MTALPTQFVASDSNWIPKSKWPLSIFPLHPYLFLLLRKTVSNLPTVQIRFQGVSPLLCHNGQTADPRNTYAKAMKAISGKRKKTDADYDEMARLEWLAGLYRIKVKDRDSGASNEDIVIPDYVIESTIIGGAKKSKRGPQAKCGLFFTEHASLQFDGKPDEITDETLAEMFASGNFTHTIGVKVGMSKVMRTRPIFRNWSLSATCQYDPDVLNQRDIEEMASDAGKLVGLGDWRPKHGRFEAEVVAVVDSLKNLMAEVA
jgi:hypothetical protein